MVLRGNTRGNAAQLAEYLVAMNENEDIQILEVNNRTGDWATAEYLNDVILSMDLMSELTKSKKGMYHAQINPAMGEDKRMDWFKAADMLGAELGLEDQRRVIVLHEKKGRTHAHVVWERYDYDTGTVKNDSFSRLAQDRARQRMEIEFGHERTPRRNAHRPELKASLLQLWHQTGTGAQFLTACRNNNYMIAQGVGRNPFIVVDEKGRSFSLVRQLSGVRLNEVRQRLRNETLMTEKAAIVYMRNKMSERDSAGDGKEKAKLIPTPKQSAKDLMKAFTDNGANSTKASPAHLAEQFAQAKPAMTVRQTDPPPAAKRKIAEEFAADRSDKTLREQDRIRQAFAKEREAKDQPGKDRDRGLEYD
jgi:hypothetical protein